VCLESCCGRVGVVRGCRVSYPPLQNHLESPPSPSLPWDDSLTNLTIAILHSLTALGIMRSSGSPPFIRLDEPADRSTNQSDRTLPEWPPSTSGPGSSVRQDHDVLPVPHPIPHRERRSECDRRIEELKNVYGHLLREKEVRIEELRKGKDTQIDELKRERDARLEELMKERDARIEEIKGEKDARIEEVKREKDVRIEELKREKDARIEEVKRDREVAIKNVEEQLERSRREELQLREENNRLKDEITRLKVQLGQAGRGGC